MASHRYESEFSAVKGKCMGRAMPGGDLSHQGVSVCICWTYERVGGDHNGCL